MDDNASAPGVQSRRFSERLNSLFQTVHNPATGKPYTLREVSTKLKVEHGAAATAAYLKQLRDGDRTNPGVTLVEALAKVFQVNPMYFLNDVVAAQVDKQLAQLAAVVALQQALDDPKIPILAVRARGLSPESLDQLLTLVNRFRALEGLDRGDS